MNFYTGMPRFLPQALVVMGYACLAFDRRQDRGDSIRRPDETGFFVARPVMPG